MNDEATELQIADWRRQVAELYAEVRARAADDPAGAHAHWRATRERLYRDHPATPVAAEARAGFRALHFDYDRALRYEATLRAEPLARPAADATDAAAAATQASAASDATDAAAPASAAAAPASAAAFPRVVLPVSLPLATPFRRLGEVRIAFPAGERRLAVFWLEEYSGGVFLPFADATNGAQTYGAGRYLLDTAKGADLGVNGAGQLVLDFNFAYQPSCAFDPRWACPLSPAENRLDFEVCAGERIA